MWHIKREGNLYIHFHWQFLITHSGFWFVNILLWILIKKINENDKNTNFLMKNNNNKNNNKKNAKKAYVNSN